MLDLNTNAARDFYDAVRLFAQHAKPWDTTAIWYDILPDERWDLSLISQRVYGRRDEFLAVMAAAGHDLVDVPLTQRRIVLPNEATLYSMKRRAGFESIAEQRDGFAPVWV